ncbi:MAG TPA: S41 family peptidase [Solirubrobacteraceae bacterium]
MEPRGRQPLPAILAILLPVLLLAGIWLGGHPQDLPGFIRRTFVADHDTRVVNEAIDRIAHDYYRPIKKDQLANASIAGAVASLGDRFSHYLTPSEFRGFDEPAKFTGIGVSVDSHPTPHGLLIEQVFDSSPAARAGLKEGDVIAAVNGRSLAGLSSTQDTGLIKGPPNTTVRLAIERREKGRTVRRTVTATRATISEPVVASTTRTVHGVKLGIVRLATFSLGAHGEVADAVHKLLGEGVKGLVLDLRANGGGLVEEARLIASIFIAHGTIVTTRGRTQPTQTLSAAGGAIAPGIPMVVLVDGDTASSAEIVTAALQDHARASVVGTHTFGKGVFQEEEPLPNGGALDVTVGEYFTPNGRNLGGGGVKQGAGVIPEVKVRGGVDGEHGLNVALSTLAAKLR